MRLHRLRLGGLVTAATVAGALAICAAPASAALVWRQVGEISGSSLPRESFGGVSGVAADDFSDQAWLAERVVYELDYSGTFVAEVHGNEPGNETPVGGFGCHESIAAYNATGEVYVVDECDKVVFVLNSEGKYLKELTGTELSEPEGIAVDQATGNIWVAEGEYFSSERNVDEYNSKDEFVKKFKVAAKAQEGQMAFDGATGDLLLSQQSGEVFVYSQTGALLETWTGSVTPNKGFGYQPTLAANDATGDVYVTDKEHKVVDVLTSKDEYVGDITDDFSEPHGLAVSQASGKIFVSDLGYPGHVYIFSPEPVIAPDVATGAAEKVTRTTAVVHGTVNPVESEAGVPAKYYFQAYNGATVIESAEVEVTGNTTQEVTAELTGLVAGTTYEYRLVAKDANALNRGEFKPFTTNVPIEGIKTAEPTEITSSSATLHGELNPDGYQTTCWFEYTDGRRPTIKTPEQNVGHEEKVVDVSQPITDLEPNSGYGFTFICKNSFGQSESSPGSVSTLTAPPAVLGESTSPPSRTSAILLANVNPENSGTTYFFEYGLTSNYGYKTHEATLGSSADEEQRAEGLAFELETDKTYHFRVVAKSAAGTTDGPDVTFESGSLTPPGVQTGGVSAISPSGATVEGVVSTSGLITSYGFEITTDESDFGPPTGLGSVGAGFKKAPVRLELTGLAAKTTYYYKLVGTNQDGSDEGEVHQFTTAEYPPDQIAVSVLPVLTEPLTTWPSLTEQAQYGNEGAKAKAKKPAKCKRGFAKKHGKCVKKRKGKSKRKK